SFAVERGGTCFLEALPPAGFANQPSSERRGDGLELRGAYITATLRCAPPLNKPTPAEIARCEPYLLTELRLPSRARRRHHPPPPPPPPPRKKTPPPAEIARGEPYLLTELRLLSRVRVVVGLGRIGWLPQLHARGAPRRPAHPP